MAILGDNSQDMSPGNVKDALINLVNRISEKTMRKADYDKTILAKIQYCADATIGQYKIQYQNAYFTAYSQDRDAVYSNGASVYVTIPKNDMNNRLMITGLATNDSSSKTYVTALEGDQKYAIKGQNLLQAAQGYDTIRLSSYSGTPVTVYSSSDTMSNYYNLIENANTKIKNGNGFLRLGATFQTNLADSQKAAEGADYGLKLCLTYAVVDENGEPTGEEQDKFYKLNTFEMNGTPFDFTEPSPQYFYCQVDKNYFKYVKSLTAYTKNFPEDTSEASTLDIIISEISLYDAIQVYDISTSPYAVVVNCDTGFDFAKGETEKTFRASLRVNGNTVQDAKDQGLKFFWGIEDTSVTSINHDYYCDALGVGWRCVNSLIMKTPSDTDDPSSLENKPYTTKVREDGKEYEWLSDEEFITLDKNVFLGRETKLKCVIIYNNEAISSPEQIVTNINGFYILLYNSMGKNDFKGGEGQTTLTAGLFNDVFSEPPAGQGEPGEIITTLVNHTLDSDVVFKWSITNNYNVTKEMPTYDDMDKLLESCPEWQTGNIDIYSNNDNDAIRDYLATMPGAATCIERYRYYNNSLKNLQDKPEPTSEETTYINNCVERINTMQVTAITEARARFIQNYNNSLDKYIVGPSAVDGRYTSEDEGYPNVEIDPNTIDPYYYETSGSSNYQLHKDTNNTLYELTGGMIGLRSTVIVTAYKDKRAIATKSIYFERSAADTSKYTLEIVNGNQSFMYDEGGRAPIPGTNNKNPITIRPLTFKLYNKAGDLLIDSADTITAASIAQYKPKWYYYDNGQSLIRTNYKADENYHIEDITSNLVYVQNYADFQFNIAEYFNVNQRDYSTISLTIEYDDGSGSVEIVRAETNFLFTKNGELGTNGTNNYVRIIQPEYNMALRKNYFPNIKLSYDKIETAYSYGQRHLSNLYYYATEKYDANSSINNEGSYIQPQFPKDYYYFTTQLDNTICKVEGIKTAALYGYKYEGAVQTAVSTSSKWSTETVSDPSNQIPVVVINNNEGSSTVCRFNSNLIKSPMAQENPAPDIIRLECRYSSDDADTGAPISGNDYRTIYEYYGIPYYYYHDTGHENNNGKMSIEGFDPAHHLVIVGGFDEVMYDEKGLNPVYSNTPFKVYLFDTEGGNITNELLNAVKSRTATIDWNSSPGFIVDNTIEGAMDYEYFCLNHIDIYNKLMRYPTGNDQYAYYRGAESIVLEDDTPFDLNMWESVDLAVEQEFTIRPQSTYQSMYHKQALSSWVSVKIEFTRSNSTKITAEAFIPINVYCNKYGSELLNNWDGKKMTIDETGGVMIASQVAAGKKDKDNTFIGVTIGETMYPQSTDQGVTLKNEIGLFAYGKTDENEPSSWGRTAFLDANTGKLLLGQSGGSQIVLNPTPQLDSSHQQWSRIAGWYLSPDFFYKPIGENAIDPSAIQDRTTRAQMFKRSIDNDIEPIDTQLGSAGMYVPWNSDVDKDTVFLWASSKYRDIDNTEVKNLIANLQRGLKNDHHITFNQNYQATNYDLRLNEYMQNLANYQSQAAAATTPEERAEYEALAEAEQEKIDDLNYQYDYYTSTLEKYSKEISDASQERGKALRWQDIANGKKTVANEASFAVTYGGYMHCVAGDFDGQISARSGKIGTSKNNLKIMHLADDGAHYILYNKNFWVKDSAGIDQEDCGAFVNGTIMAKSGMIGKIVDTTNMNTTKNTTPVKDTVHIYRDWFPREEALGTELYDNGLSFDWTAQPTQKYILLHKNFSVEYDGDTTINGRIFATEGRLANWIIHPAKYLCSVLGQNSEPTKTTTFIKMTPKTTHRDPVQDSGTGNSYDSDCIGEPDISLWSGVTDWGWVGPKTADRRVRITPKFIHLGKVKIFSNGKIHVGGLDLDNHPTILIDGTDGDGKITVGGASGGVTINSSGSMYGTNQSWVINPDGTNNFTVPISAEAGVNCNGSIFDDNGLALQSGQSMTIGDNATLNAEDGSFNFICGGSKIAVSGSGTKITGGMTFGDGASATKIDTGGITAQDLHITGNNIKFDHSVSFNGGLQVGSSFAISTSDFATSLPATFQNITMNGTVMIGTKSLQTYIEDTVRSYLSSHTSVAAGFTYPTGEYPSGRYQSVPGTLTIN